ncbi:MAG: hypothetical protein ACKVQB_06970 [Bacteroidia bacterium]
MRIILHIFHHSRGYYTVPYDSTAGMPPFAGLIAIGIVLALVLRVWWEIIKDKRILPSKGKKDLKKKKQ